MVAVSSAEGGDAVQRQDGSRLLGEAACGREEQGGEERGAHGRSPVWVTRRYVL